MSYSCSDFADTIIDALGVTIPDESYDSPSDQADICLAEIERLRSIEQIARRLLEWNTQVGGFDAQPWQDLIDAL